MTISILNPDDAKQSIKVAFPDERDESFKEAALAYPESRPGARKVKQKLRREYARSGNNHTASKRIAPGDAVVIADDAPGHDTAVAQADYLRSLGLIVNIS